LNFFEYEIKYHRSGVVLGHFHQLLMKIETIFHALDNNGDFMVRFSNLYASIDLPDISRRVKVVGAQLKRGGCLALAQYGQPKFLTQEEEGQCYSLQCTLVQTLSEMMPVDIKSLQGREPLTHPCPCQFGIKIYFKMITNFGEGQVMTEMPNPIC
jgi:hypothetical protein